MHIFGGDVEYNIYPPQWPVYIFIVMMIKRGTGQYTIISPLHASCNEGSQEILAWYVRALAENYRTIHSSLTSSSPSFTISWTCVKHDQ